MRRFVLPLLLLGLGVPAFPSDLPVAKPESAGMSSERLDRIGVWLRDIVQRKQAAGFVTLVARHGKIVQHQAYGTRGLDVTEPMPVNALFDLASMTKPVTITAALMLLEEGRFTLSDPISNYLPEFKNLTIDGAAVTRPITVENLFTHTSGVNDPRGRAEKFTAPTLAAMIQGYASLPMRAQPGSTWLYGDSHDILGYLV